MTMGRGGRSGTQEGDGFMGETIHELISLARSPTHEYLRFLYFPC
jgi:hypothetical protein